MTMTLESIFKFGKNKGKQVEDLLDDDPDYLTWCAENEVVEFDEECLEVMGRRGLI